MFCCCLLGASRPLPAMVETKYKLAQAHRFHYRAQKRKHLERGEEGLSTASSGACREYPPQRHRRSRHSLLTNNKQIAFSISAAHPFGVTVQPQAVIPAPACCRLLTEFCRSIAHPGTGEDEQETFCPPASPSSSAGQDSPHRGQCCLAQVGSPPHCPHHHLTHGSCLFSHPSPISSSLLYPPSHSSPNSPN